MTLFDQHLHSHHSMDSHADPRENVMAAIDRGLAGLTFTEHFDLHPLDRPQCIYDDADYSKAIAELRAEFGGRLFIGKGIEVCYQRALMDEIIPFLRDHEFDLVILSVHYFHGAPIHLRENWSGFDVAEGTRRYFDTVLDAVRFCGELHAGHGRVFDVLGHMDLVKRYSHRFFAEAAVDAFPAMIHEILHGCLDADLTPEINTSTLRQGLDEAMPGPTTIRRYAELGGTSMSIGSDAHRPADVGAGLEYAADMLREVGIDKQAVFRRRDKTEVPFTNVANSQAT